MITPEALRHLRVAIIGAAREGVALARFLVRCGAQVTLSDTKPAQALLNKFLLDLDGLDVRLAFGGYPVDLLDVDILFLSPGVPPTAAIVREARERGLPISSEPRLFTQVCAAPVVGITGSSGKTTTTTLTGRMLASEGRHTWVGGNIGMPLTEKLLEAERPDVAVMELSSFQLELFSPAYQGMVVEQRRSPASRMISLEGWSPHIAAITNITPNHLDRHYSMADYVLAKSYILAFQKRDDWAVLNLDNALARELGAQVVGHLVHFSLTQAVQEGAFLRGEDLVLRLNGRERTLCSASAIPLRGTHNIANVLAASCLALVEEVSIEAIRSIATTFTGVAHRLEVVRRRQEVVFVNDSIATSPERAIAALHAYTEPLVLLAGGRDKHLPWDEWADLVLERVRVVVAFGEAVPTIECALGEACARRCVAGLTRPVLYSVASLEQAVSKAAEVAHVGEVVLLSPGGTSFDAFEDFEARGQRFRELVAAL